jgi:dGTPase
MLDSQKKLYAMTAEQSKGRLYTSSSSSFFNPFQEDVNRIIHSAAFRRLSYKTQVFVNDYTKEDYFRTRLTHSLEVAQIGKTIASNLGLSVCLTEALCLVHDLGHPPFGHAGEEALCSVAKGAFDHNVHCFKIVTELEEQYMGYNGLNLTYEVLEGIIKHNGKHVNNKPAKYVADYNKNKQALALDKYPSLEAQVSYLADDIAYITHDIEDGLRAKLFSFDDLLDIKIIHDRVQEINSIKNSYENSRLPYKLSRKLSFYLIEDVINNTKSLLNKYTICSVVDVHNHHNLLVQFSENVWKELKTLREFLFQNMYKNAQLLNSLSIYVELLTKLFHLYSAEPQKLPQSWYQKITKTNIQEVVLDYIAGMTDVYAIKQYYKWYPDH